MSLIRSRILVYVLGLGLLGIVLANNSILAQEAIQVPTVPAPVLMVGARSTEGNASVRVVNASPNVPSISVAMNGQTLAENLTYGTYKDFTDFPTGTYTVDVNTPQGSGVVSKEVVLAPDVSTTLILTGLTNGIGKTGLNLSVFLTERSPTHGKARLEVINAIPDVSAVDLIGSEPLLTEIGSGKIADAALNLEAGTYDFKLVSSDEAKSLVLDLAGTQLQADTIYTIVAIGQQSNASVTSLSLTTTSPTASSTTPTSAATISSATLTTTPTTQATLAVTTTASPTSEATVETTSEATAETTVEPTLESTVEVTSEVPTAEATAEAPTEPTAEATVSP